MVFNGYLLIYYPRVQNLQFTNRKENYQMRKFILLASLTIVVAFIGTVYLIEAVEANKEKEQKESKYPRYKGSIISIANHYDLYIERSGGAKDLWRNISGKDSLKLIDSVIKITKLQERNDSIQVQQIIKYFKK